MQKITIIGRLGRDAAIRECQDGSKMLSFTVAVNGRYRGTEKTSWYEVSTFQVEKYKNMLKWLTKGSSVIVVGELDADLDEGKDGTTRCRRSIMADSIDFNSSGTSGNTQNNETREVKRGSSKKEEKVPDDIIDEEIEVRSKKKNEKVDIDTEEYVPDEGATDDLPF